jgi:DNA/RNA-binding domain of Phe-tRNA-synthetase-like protein
MIFEVDESWKKGHPGAHFGILLMNGLENPTDPAALAPLEERRMALEVDLRVNWEGKTRADIAALPVVEAYNRYYKRFDKSYVVQAQFESVVFKGKSIPSISGLVEAMFMAEIKNLMLTAGHDADKLSDPAVLASAAGTEEYTLMRGTSLILKPGDMFMSDTEGVISSVIYGPDQRTQVTAATTRILFAVYAPPGVVEQAVRDHLADLDANVHVLNPAAQVELTGVFSAEG